MTRRVPAIATQRRAKERWVEEITSRAIAWWTPERTRGLFGDKELLFPPAESAPLLRALGLLNGDTSMSPSSVKKYMQISHMVALLEPVFEDLGRAYPVVRVLDAGCGSSHLTMLLAWCFRHRWRHAAQIVGVDRNAAIVARCRERAEMTLLDEMLRFEECSIHGLDLQATWSRWSGGAPSDAPLNALIALHACDTATDDAIALGIELGADLIAAAPCCQVELSRKWSDLAQSGEANPFSPVWSSPHLCRESAATLTDAMRTVLLRGCGYEVTPMEFVPSPHTPKNTLIRAVRRGEPDREHFARYKALRDLLGGCNIRLAELLSGEHGRSLAVKGSMPE